MRAPANAPFAAPQGSCADGRRTLVDTTGAADRGYARARRSESVSVSFVAVLLPIGTRKGLFLLRGEDRSWEVEGPLLPGWAIYHAVVDPRDDALYAATNNFLYGATVHRSEDQGQTWDRA